MGLYDRNYYQEEPERMPVATGGKSMVTILIVINVAVFFANFLLGGPENKIVTALETTPQTIANPLLWWKFLTYGFAHDPDKMNHILFNMIGLFFFGRAVESRLGRNELLRFYLVAIILGGIAWSARAFLTQSAAPGVIGASGGVVALTMLFIFWYPNTEIYLFMVLPVKAWIVGALMIAVNLFGLGSETTAFDVHMVGILFAVAYYMLHWNLSFLSPSWLSKMGQRRPSLKLHDPEGRSRSELKDEAEADRILQKIHDQGEESLTRSERKTLERHSRRLRNR